MVLVRGREAPLRRSIPGGHGITRLPKAPGPEILAAVQTYLVSPMNDMVRTTLIVALLGSAGAACGGGSRYIQGTQIQNSPTNRDLITAVEEYRMAVERRDPAALLAMASPRYWDDAGTPTGTDDFGYEDLKKKLATRFQKAEDIRYSLRYMDVELLRGGREAKVDVLIDASYSLETSDGLVRMDKRDQNRFMLQRDGDRWLFVSGM